MYNAPTGYDDVADFPFRGENVFMSMGVYIDNTAADDISSITADKLPMSNVGQLTNARYQIHSGLAVYEGSGIPTAESAGMVVPPITVYNGMEEGLWSDVISDAEGVIDFSFTIALSVAHTSALAVYTSGPNILEGTVVFSNNGEEVTEELDPSTGCATASGAFTYDTITVNITKIDAAFSHVRIAEIEFGDSVTISIDELANKITFIDEIDPLQIGMPMQELDFDLINISGAYDEDRPNSLYTRLAIGNPINLSFTLGSGSTRYTIPMGRFVIGEKGSKNNCVSVVAYDVRWKLSQMYNIWMLDPSISLGAAISNILETVEIPCSIDSDIYEIYPLASHTFTNDTPILSDLHLIAQAYGLSILPDRSGIVQIRTTFPSDDFGELPVQNQITWPESSQMSKYNYIDIGYGSNQHYTVDYRSSPNVARSPISIYNALIVNQDQAIAVANRIASRLYTKAVKVRWLADPTMDLYDEVDVYSQWTEETETPATFKPIKREITYDGILTEETTFIQ